MVRLLDNGISFSNENSELTHQLMSLSTKFLAHRKPKFQLCSFDNLNRTFPDNPRRLVKRLVAGEGRGRTWREIQRAPVRDSGGGGGERVCGSERAPATAQL